jgi:hypothetical protein
MDTRGPYAIEESNQARRRDALQFRNSLQHRIGALNIMHSQHRYNLTHGSEIERQRAMADIPKLNALIGVIENRIRLTNNELAGISKLGPLDPNSKRWDEEYNTFLGQPPQNPAPRSEN